MLQTTHKFRSRICVSGSLSCLKELTSICSVLALICPFVIASYRVAGLLVSARALTAANAKHTAKSM